MSGSVPLPMEAYLAALAGLPAVGPAGLRRMLRSGSPATVWELVASGRLPAEHLPSRAAGAERLRVAAAGTSPAEVWARCRRHGVAVVPLGSPEFPDRLAADPDPPAVVFLRGEPALLASPTVAVVGTRRATGYGRQVAHDLAAGLTAVGVSVVSGLALGIDAAAHAGALSGSGAGPVAVVAAGLDRPGPRRNAALAREVARRGVLVSELPPGCAPEPWRFPVRNRLLVALSEAVVVVESARGGGSMSTVGHALHRDRPLLAVPGPIGAPVSEGTNALLADGALVCTGLDDVLCAIGRTVPGGDRTVPGGDRAVPGGDRAVPGGDRTVPGGGRVGRRDGGGGDGGGGAAGPRPAPDVDGARLLEHLGWSPTTTEALVQRSGLDLAPAVRALGRLEDQGWVRRRGGLVERVGGGA